MKKTFKQDFRESNAGLHLLYVKWAVQHLRAIDECIVKLDEFSNLNLLDTIRQIFKERDKLVKNNAAYADAQEILDSLEKKNVDGPLDV